MFFEDQRTIVHIYDRCKSNTHNINDISELVSFVRMARNDLSDDTAISLLKIASEVLSNHVILNMPLTRWRNNNSEYFAGNMVSSSYDALIKQEFANEYQRKFSSKCFGLDDIGEYLVRIIENYTVLKNDFYLRNPEVILRDDVKITNQSIFIEKGAMFAEIIKNAFDENQ